MKIIKIKSMLDFFSQKKNYDIAIVGSLLSVDKEFARKLCKNNLKIIVLREKNKSSEEENPSENYEIFYYTGKISFIKKLLECRVVCSFTATLPLTLGKYYPIKYIPGFPKSVNISTGSETTELLSENSKVGWLYRHHINTSKINWMVDYPHSIKNIIKFKIKNVHLWPFPGLHICPDMFPDARDKEYIIFAHTSRIDFKVNDPGKHRNSSKGNDRFIRSFIRAIEQKKINAKCILIEHGPDAKEALDIIKKSTAKDSFIIIPPMPKLQLMDLFSKSDVVVDQFDVGGFGGTAIEAMSGARPVITYLATENIKLLFDGDTPPVLNCWSEDEIYKKILECTDKNHLHEIGKKSREWVYRHYDSDNVLNKFLLHYALITGHVVKDYEWDRTAYD